MPISGSERYAQLLSDSPALAGAIIAVFVTLGLVGCSFGVRNAWNEYAATRWPTAPGVVTGSELRVSCGGRSGCTRMPDILYVYDVAGERFSSDRVTFGGVVVDWTTPEADQVVARYPVGASVIVYFNPRNHDEAVLEPGRYTGVLLVGVLGALSLGAAYSTYRKALGPEPKVAGVGLAA